MEGIRAAYGIVEAQRQIPVFRVRKHHPEQAVLVVVVDRCFEFFHVRIPPEAVAEGTHTGALRLLLPNTEKVRKTFEISGKKCNRI